MEDNLLELIQSMQATKKGESATRTILQCLKDSWCFNAEAVGNVESMWTGEDRENWNPYSPAKAFLVVITLTTYLSPTWE
jgi:hypothetical protein